MKQTIVLGNIITMDEKRSTAKAALVKDGVFAYIGDADEVKKLAESDAVVLDYGENFIYPGFLESHCHSYLAGDRAIGQANLFQVIPTDYDKYREIIKDYIKANPQREFYMAAGWTENDEYVTKAYLDEICADKILLMQTGGGHSMLLNSKALEWAGIDAAYAKKMGSDLVHVDENGEPDGYICEAPVFELYPKLPTSLENAKDYLLAWQDMALATGSIPAVPPLWTAEIPGFYDIEVSYVGKELAEESYPIKSFFDAGAYPVFHSDYPVSPSFSIKDSIYMAETRNAPKGLGIESYPHNVKEAITREQSLQALTINVAYTWHEEHRLGSIEFGKIANMTVYDCDFLHDDIEKVAQANLVATIVDGEEVYKRITF